MTVESIRFELHAIRDSGDRSISTLRRASRLVGELTSLGLSPRRLGLSLRQLGLNPRAVTRRGRR